MKISVCLLVCLPLLVQAQEETGIQFEQGISWDEIKEKAMIENKYIFLDCYATWCAPCKTMDKNIYTLDNVGKAFNNSFVSVKIQMDSSKLDNDKVKKMYSFAKKIHELYSVTAFPTYLFFSPKGEIVHKAIGYKSDRELIGLAVDATDSSKQYYTLLKRYKQGARNYMLMRSLAKIAQAAGEEDMSYKIVKEYKDDYLIKLNNTELCKKENLEFIVQFPKLIIEDGAKGKYFNLFYNHAEEIDNITYAGFAKNAVKNIIIKDEKINELLLKNGQPIKDEPDWKPAFTRIKQKYNIRYAEDIISEAQLAFYGNNSQWNKYSAIIKNKIKMNPPQAGGKTWHIWGDSWSLNGYAWTVFLHCNDKSILLKALKWSELSITLDKPNPNLQYLDTKANLLYKLGRIDEAIALEKKTIELALLHSEEQGLPKELVIGEFNSRLEKMIMKKPTWKSK